MEEALAREIRRRLDRIKDIAREMEVTFELPAGIQDTRGFDRRCGEIKVHSDWIREHLEGASDDWTLVGAESMPEESS